jgi:hypothetical protein
VVKLESDLLKAALAGNADKLLRLYKKLLLAKYALAIAESRQVDRD